MELWAARAPVVSGVRVRVVLAVVGPDMHDT